MRVQHRVHCVGDEESGDVDQEFRRRVEKEGEEVERVATEAPQLRPVGDAAGEKPDLHALSHHLQHTPAIGAAQTRVVTPLA